ncbi:EAL domain-containing protein [Lachnospira multipara]|uniref:EAL domain-containing protein n=1 Tax=Lachnospira multipara TaxID=28051 RepID=UPI0004240C59|nr:EAL domain-containing protein [Lachnospira multipara]
MGKVFEIIDKIKILQIIRQALVMIIPILLVGSFALILETLPIYSYQIFIDALLDGFFRELLQTVYNATFGMLAIYMTITLALSISNTEKADGVKNYSLVFISLIVFAIFSGGLNFREFDISNLGEDGVFTAIFLTIITSYFYILINDNLKHGFRFYSSGADDTYTQMLYSMPATIIVFIIAVLIYMILVKTTGMESIQEVNRKVFLSLFFFRGGSVITSLAFLMIQSILWFLGIHGSSVMTPGDLNFDKIKNVDTSVMLSNQHSFTTVEVFAVMGGCGSTLCLALAILIFGKKNTSKKLVTLSSVPLIFNVNELLLFGLPIVLNPVYFIPFILVPVISYLNASLAMALGIVPRLISNVKWTTPIFINGFMATGSIAGSLLQLFNLFIGVAIYAPFVVYSEKRALDQEAKKINELIRLVKESEEEGVELSILGIKGGYGVLARSIADEIQYKIENNDVHLRYQPQFNSKDKCIGVECLLNWEYSNNGKIYTPLVMGLTKEMGMAAKLEKAIFKSAIKDMPKLIKILGKDCKVSINLTGQAIQMEEFERFLALIAREHKEYIPNILIEITEQDSLKIDYDLISRLDRLKKLGYRFGIDDFSMGSTSLKYLRYNVFDLVKIDGNLSLDVVNNERSREIVSFLTNLTNQFNIDILAEYVENEEQKLILESIGCLEYQGYYYSEAVDIDRLEAVLINIKEKMGSAS